jgi:ABC-type polysaccharide/polyol phosphate export permease
MTRIVRAAFAYPGVTLRHRELLGSFVWRELAARYEGSLMGRLWPVIYPAVLLAIYHFVFAQLLGLKMGGMNPIVGQGWATTFYMLSGILPWIFFSESVAGSTGVVLENANLIKKISFRSELLPCYVVVVNLFHFAISISLFMLLYSGIALFASNGTVSEGLVLLKPLVWMPVIILLQLVFTLGLGMLVSTLNVFLRDLRQVIPLLLLLWMFVTPIFYGIEMVERAVVDGKAEAWMVTLMQSNPLYHLLALYRAVFSGSPETVFPMMSLWIFAALATAMFVVGHGLFISCKGSFADEV